MNLKSAESAAETANSVMEEILNDLLPTIDEPENPQQPLPRDRAQIAASCLLRRISTQQTEKFGKSELAIIEVPAEAWVSPVAAAVPAALFDLNRRDESRVGPRGWREPNALVHVYEFIEIADKKPSDRIFEQIAENLLAAKAVIIVAHAAGLSVPQQLLSAADRHLILPELDATRFNEFLVAATANEPAEDWNQIKTSNLTPNILRLAARSGQTADDYANRIARLTDCEEKSTKKKPERKLGLDDLHGMPEAVSWAKSLAVDIAEYRAGRLPWSDCDRGALFFGPPGSGKTTVARATAEYCGLPFFATSYSQWQAQGNGHLGEVTKAIRTVFSKARATAPSIIFIDELDTVNSRGSKTRHDDWWTSIINTLLEELDGSGDREGVVVIGATNFPNKIDPAIRRSGRLDREIRIGLPDAKSLKEIYRHQLENLLPDADLDRLASLSIGKSGADVVRLARGARRRARMARRSIKFEDVFSEISGGLPQSRNEAMRRTAIHEAAHAVAICSLKPGTLSSVTICADGSLAGTTISAADRHDEMTGADIDHALMIILAGRAAEEIIVGEPSAGAGGHPDSDLAKATRLALLAETSFGLGSTGLVWSDVPDLEEIHTILVTRPEAQAAIRRRLDAAYAKTLEMVEDSRVMIERIAEILLDRFALGSDEIVAIMNNLANECRPM